MTIIENSILHLTVLISFLAGLGFLILGMLKRKDQFFYIGFGTLLIGFLQTGFLSLVKGDFFVLSSKVDYSANFFFSVSSWALGLVSIIALTIYYQHRIVPRLYVQLGLFFASIVVLITFSTSVSQTIAKRSVKPDGSTKFQSVEEYQKGSPQPKLSKTASKGDSVIKQ